MTRPALPPVTASMDENYNRRLQVGDKILSVEVVSTPSSQALGLSGRASLKDSQGMLFDFGQRVRPAFWMKDMNFGLDIIWVSGGKIIGITGNVPAPDSNQKSQDSNLKLYYPPSPADMVLEVNAGWSGTNRIKIGDEVRLQ